MGETFLERENWLAASRRFAMLAAHDEIHVHRNPSPSRTMKKLLSEFREFALKGNVVDLAVGVVIGAAFGSLVDGIVKGIIEPIVAIIQNTVSKGAELDAAALEAQGAALQEALIGGAASFGSAVFRFVILAAVVFFVFVKPMNKLRSLMEKKVEADGEPEVPADVKLLGEIRDLLKERKV